MISNAVFQTALVQRFCDFYTRNKALTVEVLSINTPRTLIVRNKNEMLDTAFNEFMNSLGYFGGLKVLGMALDKIIKSRFTRTARTPAAFRFAKTAFLVPAFMGYMVAMPFYRNAMTAWRSKTLDFRDLITQEQHHNPDNWQRFAQKNLRRGHWALAIGAVVGILGFAVGAFKPHRVAQWARRNAKAFDYLTLAGKTGDRLKNDFQAIFYWGVPTYLTWMASARDMFEVKEQALRFANFMVMFSLPGKLVDSAFTPSFASWIKRYPKLFKDGQFSTEAWRAVQKTLSISQKKTYQKAVQSIMGLQNKRTLCSFLLTTFLMSISPAVINIYLTNIRLKAALDSERELKALKQNP